MGVRGRENGSRTAVRRGEGWVARLNYRGG